MTQNLAARQAALIDSPDLLAVSRDSRSGSEWADLLLRMWKADPRCVVCGIATESVAASRKPENARLLTLVPCALLDENGGRDRLGYVPGNLALACWDCVRRANDYGIATGEAVVFTPDSLTLPENVWVAWPALAKRKGHENEHSEAARKARQALGLPF